MHIKKNEPKADLALRTGRPGGWRSWRCEVGVSGRSIDEKKRSWWVCARIAGVLVAFAFIFGVAQCGMLVLMILGAK